MTYKSKGEVLQTYDLCQKGYTYQIFRCNATSPKRYLAKRMLSPHARVMALFGTFEGKNNFCVMYNLYNPTAFSKASYNHEKITNSWCYEESNESHPSMRYKMGSKVKEGTDINKGNGRGRSSERGYKMYQPY